MASSSRRSWRYDVFPSFSGEDVRKSFLSHLLDKLRSKLIVTFIDHGIERSRPIGPELLSAIRDSRISIVVFSKKYACSTWCLNELAEIYKCHEESDQMVIPIFYEVDPSHVRKQTGDFGKAFETTCEGKTEDDIKRWKKALAEVASIAGEDSWNWSDESKMIERISSDVSNKLFTSTDDFRDFVGIQAHVEAIMDSMLCLESEEVRMVGILGPSGIGKSTIARALYNRLSSQFEHRAFVTSKRASMKTKEDDYSMKLAWAKQFLSEILGQKDIEIESLGMVEQRLKLWKVLIVLDDVNDIELLKTLARRTSWFRLGSRIIVVTQDRALLESHEIDLVYEVDFPSEDLALQMFCQSAFRQTSPPDGFMDLAAEVVKLAGNLPLCLNVLGSSLLKKDKEYWGEMMPRLQNGLNGDIQKTLRICYDGLSEKDDQDMFLYIACLFNGETVNYIKNLLPVTVYPSASISLKTLADKSLLRIIGPHHAVQMHILLQKLGRQIVREESIHNPGERRFLVDAKDIYDVFEDDTGTNNVLGICCNTSEIDEPLSMDEKSFQRMRNLQFLKFYKDQGAQKTGEVRLSLPQGLIFLPRKLRLLHWDECPLKCMPSNFKAEYLVKLSMKNSKLDKLWEGTQQLRSLKKINIARSRNLKEIPDLSNAINLETMDLLKCTSLVTLPSSIRNLKKLIVLRLAGCSNLEVLPADVNLESLNRLDLRDCSRLRSFPKISKNISQLGLDGTAIEEEDSSWIENISRSKALYWNFCPLRCLPSNVRVDDLFYLDMKNSKLEKLWEGVQSLGSLVFMNLSGSENLKEFPNLSMATKLIKLSLSDCKSLVTVPCSIRSLNNLQKLIMKGCTGLESLPTNLNLKSLSELNLSGCSKLKSFPQISRNIMLLNLNYTAIEEVPSWINYFSSLYTLLMRGCKSLKNISSNIFELEGLRKVDFSDCEGVTEFGDAEIFKVNERACLNFHNCFGLDQNTQKLIIQSDFKYAFLPGGQVPEYFTHRACGSSLTIPLPKSSLLVFKACIVLEPLTVTEFDLSCVGVCWYFRGKTGVRRIHFYSVKRDQLKMDHLLLFHFVFPTEEEVTEFPPELDYDNVKFEFYYRIYGCSHKQHKRTCDTEACPYSVQRIKGCGMQSHETVKVYRDLSSSLEDEAELIENAEPIEEIDSFLMESDNKSLPSSDEEELWDGHLVEDEELNLSSFLEEEEDSDNLPTHYTITPEDIAKWISEATYQFGETAVESGRSENQMQMTVITSQQPSNLPGQNLTFDETSLNHSLSPSYPEGETLRADPIITAQDGTHCGSFLVSPAHKLFQMQKEYSEKLLLILLQLQWMVESMYQEIDL